MVITTVKKISENISEAAQMAVRLGKDIYTLLCNAGVSTIEIGSGFICLTWSSAIFTRTWLRYVRVFAVAIPSVVCRLSVCRLSVTLVHPTQGVEALGKISSPLCTLAILWPLCKILRRSSPGNPSVGGVKRKRGIKIERFRTGAISHKRYKVDV